MHHRWKPIHRFYNKIEPPRVTKANTTKLTKLGWQDLSNCRLFCLMKRDGAGERTHLYMSQCKTFLGYYYHHRSHRRVLQETSCTREPPPDRCFNTTEMNAHFKPISKRTILYIYKLDSVVGHLCEVGHSREVYRRFYFAVVAFQNLEFPSMSWIFPISTALSRDQFSFLLSTHLLPSLV